MSAEYQMITLLRERRTRHIGQKLKIYLEQSINVFEFDCGEYCRGNKSIYLNRDSLVETLEN